MKTVQTSKETINYASSLIMKYGIEGAIDLAVWEGQRESTVGTVEQAQYWQTIHALLKRREQGLPYEN